MTASPESGSTAAAAEFEIVRSELAAEYDVLEELGRGGMAIVYRGRERQLDRDVAIKTLPLALAFDPSIAERFQREARTAAQLEHPNIVPIHRVGQAGRVIYFAMKYVRGQSLASILRARGRLSPGRIRRILLDTSAALGYAAERGVVHRDIKPDNILVDDGRCVLTDFGIARSASEGKLTSTGTVVGTPQYMSPEQARAAPTDGRSDIYSLGIVAYECLVGRRPFDGPDALAVLLQHVETPVPEPVFESDDARALYASISRMLAKRPDERFQHAAELVAVLEALPLDSRASQAAAADSAASATDEMRLAPLPTRAVAPVSVPAPRRRRRWRARLLYGLAGAVVASAALLAWDMLPGGQPSPRSRCPQLSANTFLILLDPLTSVTAGDAIEVRYDVCGLEPATPFTASFELRKQESSIKRLLGGAEPLVRSQTDEASGPAERRTRNLKMGRLSPGRYTLTLVVTDNRERRRQRTADILITARHD